MKLIFATNNENKAREINAVLPDHIKVITLKEAGIDIEIPEPHDTLRENALEKANVIFNLTQSDCFSEDTGLEVKALNGAPGVRSARYAGEGKSEKDNIEKLLKELEGNQQREAQFRTVVCLIINGEAHFFEGICKGRIIEKTSGDKGFGYDPVFMPEAANKTFAEMTLEEKSRYSHRKQAIDKLVVFLNNLIRKKQD